MAEKKVGFFGSIAKYFKELGLEIKKIVWPSVGEASKNSLIVIASIMIIGLFVFALDGGLYFLLGKVMDLAK